MFGGGHRPRPPHLMGPRGARHAADDCLCETGLGAMEAFLWLPLILASGPRQPDHADKTRQRNRLTRIESGGGTGSTAEDSGVNVRPTPLSIGTIKASSPGPQGHAGHVHP